MQSSDNDSSNSSGGSILSGPLDSTPLWNYVMKFEKNVAGGNTRFKCKFCEKDFSGSYYRVKTHLLRISGTGIRVCEKVRDEDLISMKRLQDAAELRMLNVARKQVPLPSGSSSSLSTCITSYGSIDSRKRKTTAIENSYKIQTRTQIDEEIAKMFYTGCTSFNLAKNPHFIKAFQLCADNSVVGYRPPSYNKLRTTLLDNERSHIHKLLEPIRTTWQGKGVTIVSDGWTGVQIRPLINLIAITDGVAMFLKAINCQGEVKDRVFISEKIKEVIEEVGPANVVQVITDNASVCKAAGMLIEAQYDHIFWTPCVVHTLNLALKNICAAKNTEANQIVYDECSWISIVASDVLAIKHFITNHSMRLAMFKYHSDLKLLDVAETRFASTIVMLRRFVTVKEALKQLIIDSRWSTYKDGYEAKARIVREKILDETRFWKQIEYILAFTEPIYEVLRVADTDTPCLHLVYDMWDSMIHKVKLVIYQKEEKREVDQSSFFEVVHKILTERWQKSTTPLHCLAHSLNPM